MLRRRRSTDSQSRRRGATLIEVMLVVTIIGIIASMAIPGFLGFVIRTKTSEQRIVFAAISKVVLEEAMRNPTYALATTVNPPLPVTGAQKYWGTPLGDWTRIAYAPDGRVRFHYQVTLDRVVQSLIIDGYTDLDGDNLPSHWQQVWLQQANGIWTPIDLINLNPNTN